VATRQIESEVRQLVEPILAEAGLELVETVLKGTRDRRLLRLDIDRAGARGVDLAECQRVSRALGERLDEAELFPGRYVLEVSSPGIDRPIRTDDDIRRNTGRRVVVTVAEVDGARRSYRGTLRGRDDGTLQLEGADREAIRIPLEGVVSVRQEIAF
jgi:ribosome maturation factor RimP